MYESKHLTHTDLLDNKGNPLSITFVYGRPEHSKRGVVWQKLRNMKNIPHPNWQCIGDFNQILSREEKLSFSQGTIVGVDLFQQVISELQLCDLVATGQRFTWMNNRKEDEFVMERLDRAFASVEWVNTYPHYALKNHPIIRSNHGPILLDFKYQHPFSKRPFRFECLWITHFACKDMIQQAWRLHTNSLRAAQLNNKLSNVRKEATNWNRSVFGRVEIEIKRKMVQLQDIQNSVNSIKDVRKEIIAREELEELVHKEELTWA